MTKWQQQIRRSAAQALYWRDHRYAVDQKGTVQTFIADILADDYAEEGPFSPETTDPAEWLRRYIGDYRDKKTGRCVYTIPGHDRYEAVQNFVEAVGFLASVALLDHTEPAYAAALVASANGYDRFADQTLLAGTFRGMFLGATLTDNGLTQCIFLCHFIPGEEYFRVRVFETLYPRRAGENDAALIERAAQMDWESWSRRDGFASFNPVFGALFLLRGECGGASGYDVSDFAFDSKGRRVLALTATPQEDGGSPIRFQLAQQPGDIDHCLAILRQIGANLG